MELSDYSTQQLQDELRRRKERPSLPTPAGKCMRCGEEWYYIGMWKPWMFEIQARDFESKHRNCPLSFNGGGI